jgi:hypothetical protein
LVAVLVFVDVSATIAADDSAVPDGGNGVEDSVNVAEGATGVSSAKDESCAD